MLSKNRNLTGRALITAAPVYAITLQEAKDQVRVTHSNEDDKLNLFIAAACDYTEQVLSRTLIEQTWDLYYDAFPCGSNAIEIGSPPLISITSVKYIDSAGAEQTWDSANYTVDTDQAYQALIYPAINASYPSARDYPKAVIIRAVTGYENSGASPVDYADKVPSTIKQAILLLLGHMWENRENSTIGIEVKTIPMGYDAMLASHKVRKF